MYNSDSIDNILQEESNNSSDQVSWYSSDYDQQEHDLEILDNLQNKTQYLIERQNTSSLLKKKNRKYSQNLITSLKNERYIKRTEILSKPDSFFEDIQQFREENEKYTKSHEIKEIDNDNNKFPPPQKCSEYMRRSKLDDKYLVDNEKYYGYYSLNERLFPVNENKCYLYSLNDIDDKKKESNNETDEYPIKISIKKDQFKPVKQTIKHHRRKSYDPYESVSLKSYLHKGYDTMYGSRKKQENNTLSLNKELGGKNPKEITFNRKYYFY